MTEKRERRPGDTILDRYVPRLKPKEREEARSKLYDFVAWQLRIIIRLVREEADSRDGVGDDKLEFSNPSL